MPRVVPIQIDEKWPSLTGIRSWVMFFLTWSIDIALAKLGRASANQPYPSQKVTGVQSHGKDR